MWLLFLMISSAAACSDLSSCLSECEQGSTESCLTGCNQYYDQGSCAIHQCLTDNRCAWACAEKSYNCPCTDLNSCQSMCIDGDSDACKLGCSHYNDDSSCDKLCILTEDPFVCDIACFKGYEDSCAKSCELGMQSSCSSACLNWDQPSCIKACDFGYLGFCHDACLGGDGTSCAKSCEYGSDPDCILACELGDLASCAKACQMGDPSVHDEYDKYCIDTCDKLETQYKSNCGC